MRKVFFWMLAMTLAGCSHLRKDPRPLHVYEPKHEPSAAYRWLEVILETSARDVDKVGARPTIISRQMMIPLTAMYDAWAAYDEKAVGTQYGGQLRRPIEERTQSNKEKAIAYAAYRTLLYAFPDDTAWVTERMRAMGYDPKDDSKDKKTPQGIGNLVAAKIIEYRKKDGSNQEGKMTKSAGVPYGDYTGYRPVNPPGTVKDPDRWGPLPFVNAEGKTFYPGYLTPHWHLVKPFALKSGAQFRAPPYPKVGNERLKKEVEELVRFNATLTPEQKAVVEFMRDGPRSTGQSGHWLRFAQDVSRRDKYDLDRDIKLFFSVANVCFDAFISAWETKRYYDSSRPWHLVRHYYKGQELRGWKGAGQGVDTVKAEDWLPYSPPSFLTPPFPGYVSGHSTVSAAAAKILELFTGSDHFGFKEVRKAGVLTEENFSCAQMQKGVDGNSTDCMVTLDLPTFTATAEMAGISRVMGAYHIQADNIEGLKMGKKVAEWSWPIYQSYFEGTK